MKLSATCWTIKRGLEQGTPPMSSTDMQDLFSNIMVLTALMLTLVVSIFGTASMSDLMLLDYRHALVYKDGFRELVVLHLTEKEFNFTKPYAPGVYRDLRELLLYPTDKDNIPTGIRAGSYGQRTQDLDFVFHMTKDDVDPWVMGTVAQTDHGSSGVAWCYAVSAICFLLSLLLAFFHYMAIVMSNVGERRELAEKIMEKKSDELCLLEKEIMMESHIKEEDVNNIKVKVNKIKADLEKLGQEVRSTDIGLYVYLMGWALVLASIVGIVIFFIGLADLTRARYPQLASTQFLLVIYWVWVGAPICASGVVGGLALQCYLGRDWWRKLVSLIYRHCL